MKRCVGFGLLLVIASVAQQPVVAPDADSVVTFSGGTRLVEAYASVFDARGNPIPNLTKDKFHVLDGGAEQPLVAFEGAEDGLSCALLLDITGSMEEFLPALKNSVLKFLDELRPEEEVAYYSFNSSVQLAQPFTKDKKLVKQAVMRARANGLTALFDAVSRVSRDLEARPGKKALVLFTDGHDTASSLTSSGAARRARLNGVPIYALAQGEALKSLPLIHALEQLSADTGGMTFRLEKPDKISEVFSEISRDMKHTYLLSWKPPQEPAGSAVWRPVKISVNGVANARIRARQGYLTQ